MSILETRDIKETQRILMDIMLAFDKACRDNNAEYFLAGGSCLGAVRHEGFLPWDDDIDLYMKASEWEAKRDIIRDALPPRYAIVCNEYNPYYCNPVIRIVDTQTTQIARSRITDRSEHGVQIDIFLLDPIPEDKIERQEYIEDFWVYGEIKTPTMQMANPSLPVTEAIRNKYHAAVDRVNAEGRAHVVSEMEERLFNYKESDCSQYHLRWGGYWVEIPISAFSEAIDYPFEGHMLPIPAGYPDVLYGEYGHTWMIIPPASNIWTHDTVENYNVSYVEYDKEIAKVIDLDEYRKVQEKNKDYKLGRLFLENKLRKQHVLNREAIALALLKSGDGVEQYVAIQKQLFKDHHIINVEDDFLARVLYDRIIAGDLDFARGISKFYAGDNSKVLELLDDVNVIRKINDSYYLRSEFDNIDVAKQMLQKYDNQLTLLEFISQSAVRNNMVDDNLENMIAIAIATHGKRPRLMKASADIAMLKGDVETANAMYDAILETSRDGMVNLEILKLNRKESL